MKTTIMLILFSACMHVFGLNYETYASDQANNTVTGIVFHDKTGSGSYETGEDKPLEGIAVSNGREIAITDENGGYQLPLEDNSFVFVIKPQNWRIPVDEDQLPQFYYTHSTGGLSGSEFRGLSPTGPSPESVNFPLYPVEEPDNYEVLVFGDTQPRNEEEIYHISHDALFELGDTDAAFGVTLGDNVFDNLDLFDQLAKSIATIGIPWQYVLGNHDIDFTADDNMNARGTFFRQFGPSYYSFTQGPAHFIVLDNIRWIVEDDDRYYQTGLGENQLEFLQNELSRIDNDQLVVLMAHIPWIGSNAWEDEQERDAFFELLAEHPNSVSLVSHHHRHYHHFIGEEYGFPVDQPHHMVVVGTLCGSWWGGTPDEYGIPHAMMSDGTPTSYTFLHIDENDWKMRWKASRKPDDFQMNIHSPDVVKIEEVSDITVTANIFNALPSAKVEMKVGEAGQWSEMKRVQKQDPIQVAAAEWERKIDDPPWRVLGESFWEGHESEYLWEKNINTELGLGVHVIQIKAVDDWWEYEGRRLIRVIE